MVKNNRNKWSFIKHPSKPIITSREVSYWKTSLKKILKIGAEFEFNLKENKNNICTNKTKAYCPCNYIDDGCWEICNKIASCSLLKLPQTCKNKTDKCDITKCSICNNFSFKCIGVICSYFESNCISCEEYTVSCDTCPLKYDSTQDPEISRKNIIKKLKPSNTYGIINKSCIHSITTDGSLLGKKGVEIITTGRRIDYWEFYQMAKNIINIAVKNGAYINERCSIHMHLLNSYYDNILKNKISNHPNKISELEHSIPQIILANFHQLCRKYQNAITWMTVGLDDPNRLTRWEKFRVSILNVSALTHTMEDVKYKVSNNSGGNKYGWLNYNYTTFDPQGNISRFHVEFRGCDAILSPSAIASIACLYYCLILKAVEISKFGILTLDDDDWMKQAEIVKKELFNNMKNYGAGDRFSDTSKLYLYYNYLRKESIDLIQQLKHQLIRLGPSYHILKKLAQSPIGLERVKGKSWEDIEQDLAVKPEPENILDNILSEYIDLRIISNCTNIQSWTKEVLNSIKKNNIINEKFKHLTEPDINQFIKEKLDFGKMIWSTDIGAPVLL